MNDDLPHSMTEPSPEQPRSQERVHWTNVQTSLFDVMRERDALAAKLERVEAGAAAMREALRSAPCGHSCEARTRPEETLKTECDCWLSVREKALATDAGRDWVRKEDVKPLTKALNGFKWLGNNLHNVREAPDDFIGFYETALKDA